MRRTQSRHAFGTIARRGEAWSNEEDREAEHDPANTGARNMDSRIKEAALELLPFGTEDGAEALLTALLEASTEAQITAACEATFEAVESWSQAW